MRRTADPAVNDADTRIKSIVWSNSLKIDALNMRE